MEFKRGDTVTHTLVIPKLSYKPGLRVFFMAKETMDDDMADSAAIIARDFRDSDIVKQTENEVTYSLRFTPADTNSINLDGAAKKELQGEFEFRYIDGRVKTFPEKGKPLKIIVYSDVRRGNG